MKWLFAACTTVLLLIVIAYIPASADVSMNQTIPKGKILSFLEDEQDSNSLDGRAGNKTQKILTRPPQTTTTTTQNPYMHSQNSQHQNPHYSQYSQPPQYNQHPSYIGGGDSFPQGSGIQTNVQQPPIMSLQNEEAPPGIPAIYVQLIGALEKFVERIQKLEDRMSTAETILYHMTNKKAQLPDKGSCPNNFRKIENIRGKCYQISSYLKHPMIHDWKSAENECTKVGGRLVEMLNYEDFVRVSQFLIKYSSASNSATSDYWIGGINPGLIWIWADSGQPVDMNKQFWNDTVPPSTVPGCLKMKYSHSLNTYFFRHSPCDHAHNYICEIMDNTISRALAHFEEQLWNESETL